MRNQIKKTDKAIKIARVQREMDKALTGIEKIVQEERDKFEKLQRKMMKYQ